MTLTITNGQSTRKQHNSTVVNKISDQQVRIALKGVNKETAFV